MRILVSPLLVLLVACGGPTDAPAPQTDAAPAAPARDGLARLLRRAQPEAPFEFKFSEPGEGPRAPLRAAFMAELGKSSFAEIAAMTAGAGAACSDTSVRAMMDKRRQAERERLAAARARGEDAVTAASWLDRKTKHERNPQVRFSCPKVSSALLTDRARPASEGRLLYVFDSAEHPLRHASYQRTFREAAAAIADYQDAVAHYTRAFGPASAQPAHPLPAPGPDGEIALVPAVHTETEWRYADLTIKVGILRYGDLVTVGERVEVPHGVRPDAPLLARAGAPR